MKKVYIMLIHQVSDCEDLGITTKVFTDREKAIAALKQWRDDEIKCVSDNEFIIERDEPDHFEAYEDGRYCTNHSLGEIIEKEVA